jgi:hypothetical protein
MPLSNTLIRVVVPAAIGALIGGGVVAYSHRNDVTSASGATASGGAAEDGTVKGEIEMLRTEIARLKTNAPSQSHTMADVGYHWTNLWFAADKKNWPLAMFYFEEARQHILWTIRLRPVRKDPDGNDVNLAPIFESIDSSAFKTVADAIQAQNAPAFAAAYRVALEACYSCHKASGKPYLHPMSPAVPTQSIINFDGGASGP